MEGADPEMGNQHPEAFSMSRRERMEQIETMLREAIIKIYGR